MTTTALLETTAPFTGPQPAKLKPPRRGKASPAAPVLLTVEHTCSTYGMSRSYLYKLLGAGLIATRKLGRRILIEVASIEHYMATLPPADIRQSKRRSAADAGIQTAGEAA